jgi:hypothetical protein
MSKQFVYELRQRPQGDGWHAYSANEIVLESDETQVLDQLFSETVHLNDLPAKMPWEGFMRLYTGQWTVMWKYPGPDRIHGVLLSRDEWEVQKHSPSLLISGYDPAFVQTFLKRETNTDWPENLQSARPQVALGTNCNDYLPFAERYYRKIPIASLTGFYSAAQEGVTIPPGISHCPFHIVSNGPDTIPDLVKEIKRRSQQTVEVNLTEKVARQEFGGHQPQQTDPALPEKVKSLEMSLAEIKKTIESLERKPLPDNLRGFKLICLVSCFLAMGSIMTGFLLTGTVQKRASRALSIAASSYNTATNAEAIAKFGAASANNDAKAAELYDTDAQEQASHSKEFADQAAASAKSAANSLRRMEKNSSDNNGKHQKVESQGQTNSY